MCFTVFTNPATPIDNIELISAVATADATAIIPTAKPAPSMVLTIVVATAAGIPNSAVTFNISLSFELTYFKLHASVTM